MLANPFMPHPRAAAPGRQGCRRLGQARACCDSYCLEGVPLDSGRTHERGGSSVLLLLHPPRLIRVLTAGMQPGTFGLATPPVPMMQRISRRAGLAAVVAAAEVVSVSPITRLKRDIRDISPVRRACRGTVAVAFCGFRDRKTAIFGGLLRLSGRTVAKAVIEVVAALLGKW